MCRRELRRFRPSSRFLPLGPTRKKFLQERDRISSAKPCRYFSKDDNKPYCPHWNKCRYTHIKDGKPYIFSKKYMQRMKKRISESDPLRQYDANPRQRRDPIVTD